MMLIGGTKTATYAVTIPLCIWIISKPSLIKGSGSKPSGRLCKCRDRVDPPMNENTEFAVMIPLWNSMFRD